MPTDITFLNFITSDFFFFAQMSLQTFFKIGFFLFKPAAA